MPLLRDYEYERLRELGLHTVENESSRELVFKDFALPDGIYSIPKTDVLVLIPVNYPDDGINMFWVHPYVERADKKAIPATSVPGSGHNRKFDGTEFCRWSRHWDKPTNRWRVGKDDIDSIVRRIRWALDKPDADKG